MTLECYLCPKDRVFPLVAKEVTKDNLEELGKWCGGSVNIVHVPETASLRHAVPFGWRALQVLKVDPEGDAEYAFIGDYVVKLSNESFVVMRAELTRKLFEVKAMTHSEAGNYPEGSNAPVQKIQKDKTP